MRHVLAVIKHIFAHIKCFLHGSQRLVSCFTHLHWSGKSVYCHDGKKLQNGLGWVNAQLKVQNRKGESLVLETLY